jgi:hypothetical protein
MYSPVAVPTTVDSPEKLSKLLAFCEANGIQCIAPVEPFAGIVLDKTLRKPTAEYKLLCGGEWLGRGMTSVLSVYEFLHDYARINKLIQSDGAIMMSATLQYVFKTENQKIYPYDIPRLAQNVFV